LPDLPGVLTMLLKFKVGATGFWMKEVVRRITLKERCRLT